MGWGEMLDLLDNGRLELDMAIELDPHTGEFTHDGNWTSTVVNEDGSKEITTCKNHVVTVEVIPATE